METLNKEPWALIDQNFGKKNTIYTYTFVIRKQYKRNGYAKMLKRVYLNWVKKKEKIIYVTGHVREGIASKFTGDINIIEKIENWQGTGKAFEYYRRILE